MKRITVNSCVVDGGVTGTVKNRICPSAGGIVCINRSIVTVIDNQCAAVVLNTAAAIDSIGVCHIGIGITEVNRSVNNHGTAGECLASSVTLSCHIGVIDAAAIFAHKFELTADLNELFAVGIGDIAAEAVTVEIKLNVFTGSNHNRGIYGYILQESNGIACLCRCNSFIQRSVIVITYHKAGGRSCRSRTGNVIGCVDCRRSSEGSAGAGEHIIHRSGIGSHTSRSLFRNTVRDTVFSSLFS